MKDLECREQGDVSAAPDVPRLFQATQSSKTTSQKGLMLVNAIETRWNNGNQKRQDRMLQYDSTRFCMLFDREYHFGNYCGRLGSSRR